MAQDLDIAAHRQFAHVPPGLETGFDHAVAADSGAAQFRRTLTQLRDDTGRDQVPEASPATKAQVLDRRISG